jgi:hypothetical protein
MRSSCYLSSGVALHEFTPHDDDGFTPHDEEGFTPHDEEFKPQDEG